MTDTYSAIQAMMLNDVNRLNIISHNLANATTAGFKKMVPVNRVFAEYMVYEGAGEIDEPQNIVRYEIPYMETVTDPKMGTVKYTGNNLDLVASGNTYFALLSPEGVVYTKQGSFHVNDAGVVVNTIGYPLLSETGEIVLNDGVPVIDRQGNIVVDNNTVGRIKTATFKPGTTLNSIGFGLYRNEGEEIQIPDAQINIKQGYLEMSNVVVMEEMVKLIEISRHFEIAQKFMMGYDDMLDSAINIVGEV